VLDRRGRHPGRPHRTPVDLPELGDRSAELLGEVDVDAMQELTTALADVTEGNREDVEALLDGIEDGHHHRLRPP
jgi:ABC-type transporter Mla subunit MlaD